MGAAEVGAAAADAAEVRVGLIGRRYRLWRSNEAEAVLVVEAIAAAVIVLGVDVGLVEGRGEVLARGHGRAEALHGGASCAWCDGCLCHSLCDQSVRGTKLVRSHS